MCQWVLRTLSCIFWMTFYFKMWCILMIFLLWETQRLLWAFCPHVSLINLLISFKQYFFFFFHVFFGRFQQKSYESMRKHYGSKVMGVHLRPVSGMLSLIIDPFWWYKPFIYERVCPICFSRELSFGGSIFMLHVSHY